VSRIRRLPGRSGAFALNTSAPGGSCSRAFGWRSDVAEIVVTESEWDEIAEAIETGADHPLAIEGVPVRVIPDVDLEDG
jgi:hypothetical protein